MRPNATSKSLFCYLDQRLFNSSPFIQSIHLPFHFIIYHLTPQFNTFHSTSYLAISHLNSTSFIPYRVPLVFLPIKKPHHNTLFLFAFT